MAKDSTEQKQEQAPQKPRVTVYPFQVKGTNRVYEVDRAHLEGMRSRKDMDYIGEIPLPPKQNDKAK